MALLGVVRHWAPDGLALFLFGAGWLAAGTTLGATAQMTAPAWARARALGVYQLSFFGALGIGAALWGWVGTRLGVPAALILCGATGAITAAAVRPWRLSVFMHDSGRAWAQKLLEIPLPQPRDPAPTLTGLLHADSGRVLEAVYYRIDPADRDAFLTTMRQVRQVRFRAGALVWRRYEDIARPDRWTELWTMESWTDHLREEIRLDEDDLAILARAASMHRGEQAPKASRHLHVDP